jgi:hypothetical protein
MYLYNGDARNNIALACTTNYLTSGGPTGSNNAGETGNMPGFGTGNIATAPSLEFVSVISGSEDLHLKTGAACINAGDAAGLSRYFTNDIDNTLRPDSLWDIGADEFTGTVLGGCIVFPGDCNNDNSVNVADVLPIGVFYGKTGPERAVTGCDSTEQAAECWSSGSRAVYADADGNGIVNAQDVFAIACNWHKQWKGNRISKGLASGAFTVPQAAYAAYGKPFLEIYRAIRHNRDKEGFREIITLLEEMLFVKLPAKFCLFQNNPNPFNPSTRIRFELPAASGRQLVLKEDFKKAPRTAVVLNIYDARGRLVRKLLDRSLRPGYHQVRWNGANTCGQYVGSGIYFYRITAGKNTKTMKMIYAQ